MKILLPLLTVALAACSQPEIAGVPVTRNSIDVVLNSRWKKSPYDRKTDRAFKIEADADLVVEYTGDGKMDIDIGRLSTFSDIQARTPVFFDPDELIGFFDGQRHKKLVVVIFRKSTRDDTAIQAEVSKLNAYFKDRGYRRVVIQQYYAFSRGTHSDLRVN